MENIKVKHEPPYRVLYYVYDEVNCRIVYHNINDQPAAIYDDGDTYWLHYGKKHRLNGPARIWDLYKIKEYWINGVKIKIPNNITTEEQIKQYLQLQRNF